MFGMAAQSVAKTRGHRATWFLVAWLLVAGFVGIAGQGAAAQQADALIDEAEAAFMAKRTFADGERALALFERVVDGEPEHVLAHIRMAELHYWLVEVVEDEGVEKLPVLQEGLEIAKRATELDPNEPEAYYWVGVLTGRVGEERGILQSLFMVTDIMDAVDRTLELDPNHAGAHLIASQVYRKAPGWPLSVGDRKKSVEHGEEAVRLGPDKTTHVLNLAEAYLNDRKPTEARELLQQVLDMPFLPGEEVTGQADKDRAAELLAEL